MRSLMILGLLAVAVSAQFDSPAPPRISIPGAMQLGPPRPSGFRQARVQAPQGAPVVTRIRRPGLGRPSFKSVDATPRPSLQSLEEPAKPVTEETEDELLELNTPTAYTPNVFSTEAPSDLYDFQTTTTPPRPHLFNPGNFQQPTPPNFKPENRPLTPQQFRPFNPTPSRHDIPIQKPQPARIQPLSSRPQRPAQFRPDPRPQLFQEDDDSPVQPVRQYNRAPEQTVTKQPAKSNPNKWHSGNREKKPVAQVISKYRDDNPDGSITWGFENDDGSFKEETIGVDCITRGKYGYVDPDGNKREYAYETGNPCDKNKEEEQEKGFVDYQENKAVLPNGVTIDLAQMGKKSKRPFRSPTSY